MSTDHSILAPVHVSGKYRIIAELGQGGMATVYLAVAPGPNGFTKLVVLKTVREHLVNDETALKSLLDEARLAARLNHANVVQTNEVGQHEGRWVLVMEYLEGQALSAILHRGRDQMPLSLHLRLLIEALAGLDYAHELTNYDGAPLGLVHRDVSPQNVFVTFDGHVKVLDFGIAKASVSAGETETGVLKGKIAYMAPEHMRGERIDRRADVFCVGVMLWEAIAGRRMWKGQNDVLIMSKVLSADIPKLREANPNVPERLEEICSKALAHDPNARYATAAEMERDLGSYLADIKDSTSKRDVAKFVCALFEDVRVRTRSIVEEQLRKVAAEGDGTIEPVALPTALGTRSTGDSTRDSQDVEIELSELSNAGRKSRVRWASAVGLVAILTMALLVARRKEAATSVAASEPAVANQPQPQPAPDAPKSVSVEVEVLPASARLFLDDKELPGNPMRGSYPMDSARHTLRAEAKGFQTRTVELVFDRDTRSTLALEHAAPPPPVPVITRPSRPSVARPAVVETHEAPAEPKPNCNPPYSINDQGLKKPKPECM